MSDEQNKHYDVIFQLTRLSTCVDPTTLYHNRIKNSSGAKLLIDADNFLGMSILDLICVKYKLLGTVGSYKVMSRRASPT